jgi:hypothetical protein
MAELKAKPLPAELNHALRGGMAGIPTATGEAPQHTPERVGERVELKGRQRRAPPTVQLNVAITEELADMIAEEAIKAGSTRRWLARLMKDAGYPVPEADLTPFDLRRRQSRHRP